MNKLIKEIVTILSEYKYIDEYGKPTTEQFAERIINLCQLSKMEDEIKFLDKLFSFDYDKDRERWVNNRISQLNREIEKIKGG